MKKAKDKELYIATVIYSCKNPEQLDNCSTWIKQIYPITNNMSTMEYITTAHARREFQRLVDRMSTYLETRNIDALV